MYCPFDLSYLAGFIDGEGCFFIGKFTRTSPLTGAFQENYQSYIKISNTESNVMKWIQHTFNGTNYNQWKSKSRDRSYERMIYNIQITGHNLTVLCERLIPLLKVKHEHAKVMLEFRKTFPEKRGKHFITSATREYRDELMKKLRSLNSRWITHKIKNP